VVSRKRVSHEDIDNRVRAISLAMEMIPLMWTGKPNQTGGDTIH
jgi:hypothetical protein